ncbi:DEAD/DEAH box helicase, partial [Phenylobacterium sp.]|uniref:DEAD/DEAH box helicase n=1 Tax=Phenylobacterium sp. TaxID=1871053 RepID=UPI002E327951
MTQFTDLGLSKPLLKALAEEGYETPTPIQAKAIPGVLSGRDLLGIAQTGTGKTAAFALPILQRLADDRKPAPRRSCRVLVLSPTRELATQIGDSFKTYGRHLGLTVAVVFGGVKYGGQMRALAGGVDVLVATPGRLLDHMEQKSINVGATEIFVLDEADQML